MSRFLSKRLLSLEAYTPGEQPKVLGRLIKLNTNESPFPPSPLVNERLDQAAADSLRLYPDPECSALRKKLADTYGVKSENVFVANGSDEILSFIFCAFCDETHGAAFADITYGFYKVYAQLYGINATVIPLRDDFTPDIDAFAKSKGVILIASPNAPTGIPVSLSDIERLLASDSQRLVAVDEAYVDFGAESCLSLLEKYDNLIIVRTYSKSRSMAGARVGFAIASEAVINDLSLIKYSTNPYNLDRLSLIAAEAALDDDAYYINNAKTIAKIRENTVSELEKLGFEILPSKANFIFAKNRLIHGADYYARLKSAGIIVRHFSLPRIDEFVRITIGSQEQMDALTEETRIILKEIK